MKPFTRKDFDEFFSLLDGLTIQPIDDDPAAMGVVNIRHDVDADPLASLSFAKIENEIGVQSTYFILNTADYWTVDDLFRDILHEISSRGHYIGWHNNAISDGIDDIANISEYINAPISTLWLMGFKNIGTASHGDPLCYEHGYLNYYIFEECKRHPDFQNFNIVPKFKLSDFGLTYEAYHTGHTHYISDSGGIWRQDNRAAVADFRKKLEAGEQVKLQVLIHPQWWQL